MNQFIVEVQMYPVSLFYFHSGLIVAAQNSNLQGLGARKNVASYFWKANGKYLLFKEYIYY